MILSKASIGNRFCISKISGKEKVRKFLTSLGCHEGEEITLVSVLAGNFIVNIKDSRYALDETMANCIELAE